MECVRSAVVMGARPVLSLSVSLGGPRALHPRRHAGQHLSQVRTCTQQGGRAQPTSSRPHVCAAASNSPTSIGEPLTELKELDQSEFYSFIEEHSQDRLVVVDFYTAWCGPCKLIQPTLVEWANEFAGEVELVRFECKKENKEIGSKLGIKVAPTFFLYKKGEKVASLTGAKTDELRKLIETHK
ncbi:TRXF1 [Auxenochlorella protothecoides x Auxenochlorella symbiontica]